MAEHFLYIGIPHNANKGWIDPDSSLQSTGRNERNSDVQETVIPFVEELNSAKEYMYETFKGVRAIDLYTSTYNDYIREKYTNWGKTWIYHRPALRRGGTETVLNPYSNSYHYKTLETVGLSTVFKLDVDEYPTYIKFGEGDADPYSCPFRNSSDSSGTATFWLTDQCGNYAVPIDISSYNKLDGIEPSRGWGTSQNFPYNQPGVYAASSYKEGFVPRAIDAVKDANGNPIFVDGKVQPIQTGEDPRALAGAELCLKIRGLSGVGMDGQLVATIGTSYAINCTVSLASPSGDYANDVVAFLYLEYPNDYPYSEEYRGSDEGPVQYIQWIKDLLARRGSAVGDELANIEAQLQILTDEIIREKKQATTVYCERGKPVWLRAYPSTDGHVLSGFLVSAGEPPTYDAEHDYWIYYMPAPPTNVTLTPIWGLASNAITTSSNPVNIAETSYEINPIEWLRLNKDTFDSSARLQVENKLSEFDVALARMELADPESDEWLAVKDDLFAAEEALAALYAELYQGQAVSNGKVFSGQPVTVKYQNANPEYHFVKWEISNVSFEDETVLTSSSVNFTMPPFPVNAVAKFKPREFKWTDSTFNTTKHDQEVTVTRNGEAVDSFNQPITYFLYIDGVEYAEFPANSRSVTVTLGVETESSTLQFKLVAKAPKMADPTQFIEAHGTEYPYEVGDFHRTVEYWHTVNGVQQFTTCIPYYCVQEEDNLVFVEVEPYIFHNGEWILCSTT